MTGIPAGYADEYLHQSSVRRFAKVMIRLFGPVYRRAHNEEDTERLMAHNEKRGWPGMPGSIDCMHWKWKKLPEGLVWTVLWKKTEI